ncbi:replication-associated recombination protein A [Metamycoplasma subdolum]|uniref:replication-associated recombination protein A n=1 Tax=Metamycoplasma subdolum TaxID=92407 RepID=UPI00298C3604|nr:replication-associated recombination protein A [Metamycoplasma subdolum]WPB50420.1 replication-associated recombination protein A [Metamycoplasma subdolum]
MNKNLANLLRPNEIDDFICNENQKILFKKIIENDDFRSFIFYGKPGTGKTTISYILATALKVPFDYFNAAVESKEDFVRKIKLNNILIVDEIHRLNKDKQDILLPYLENDMITIYATTTENPYFKLNPALRSRCSIIEIEKPNVSEIKTLLEKANKKAKLGLKLAEEIYQFLALQSGGDFRVALNNLDLVSNLSKNKNLTLEEIKKIIPQIQFSADKNQDVHYDYLSAFHKSLRGGDVDASLYYGFLIFKSGDFDGLFRRMLCASYEDVGLANPQCGEQTLSAILAFERLGVAEGYLPVAFAIANIALSPKSNSVYLASQKVKEDLELGRIFDVPSKLKDSHYSSASLLGRGIGYKYPHNFENSWVKQTYLPKQLEDKTYFEPKMQGYEAKIIEYWKKIKKEN